MHDTIQTAYCVIMDDYGRILLLHRSSDDVTQWELPGSVVDEDELPELCRYHQLRLAPGTNGRYTRHHQSPTLGYPDFW